MRRADIGCGGRARRIAVRSRIRPQDRDHRVLVVVSIALPVFGLILTGALAARYRLLGREVTGGLNQFVVYLALPAVLFQAMAHIQPAHLANGGLLAAFGLGIAIPFMLSMLLSWRRSTPLGNTALQALSATFCNTGYMGIPLCRMAFGDDSLVPGVITMVITACPQFGVAIALLETDRAGAPGFRRIVLRVGRALATNPLLLAPVAGLALAMADLELPLAADRFLTLMGGAATPCALVATGLMLGETTERFQPGLVTRLVVLKLFVQPAVVWVLAFHVFTLPPLWAETAVLMAAMPTGAGAFILARLYGREAASTSGTILVSTVLSFATLSVLLIFLAP